MRQIKYINLCKLLSADATFSSLIFEWHQVFKLTDGNFFVRASNFSYIFHWCRRCCPII